jgi:hypothetical protein
VRNENQQLAPFEAKSAKIIGTVAVDVLSSV